MTEENKEQARMTAFTDDHVARCFALNERARAAGWQIAAGPVRVLYAGNGLDVGVYSVVLQSSVDGMLDHSESLSSNTPDLWNRLYAAYTTEAR